MLEVQTTQPISFRCDQMLSLAQIKARFPSAISLEAVYEKDMGGPVDYIHRVIMPYKFTLSGLSLYGDRTDVNMRSTIGAEITINGSESTPLPSVEVLAQDIEIIHEYYH